MGRTSLRRLTIYESGRQANQGEDAARSFRQSGKGEYLSQTAWLTLTLIGLWQRLLSRKSRRIISQLRNLFFKEVTAQLPNLTQKPLSYEGLSLASPNQEIKA